MNDARYTGMAHASGNDLGSGSGIRAGIWRWRPRSKQKPKLSSSLFMARAGASKKEPAAWLYDLLEQGLDARLQRLRLSFRSGCVIFAVSSLRTCREPSRNWRNTAQRLR
jgi:hypothetical protein